MPPRVRLTADESSRLPTLLARVEESRDAFPSQAEVSIQLSWIQEHYSNDDPLSLNLITLLLFEYGVHRSVDQVAQDLAILRKDP